MIKLTRTVAAIFFPALLTGCLFTPPPLPQPQRGKALLVMGFTTDLVEPYEGGNLHSGFTASRLDDEAIEPPLTKGAYRIVEPGLHRLSGECFWRLRGTLPFQDDLLETGTLEWRVEPGRVYTLASEIDEYKFQCSLSIMEKPWR